MRLDEVIALLEEFAPSHYAEEWDNSGLMCGRRGKEIRRIFVSVDATDEVVEEAVRGGADLLLTHHPLIFRSIRSVTEEDITGRRLLKLIAADIACYAMHTNYDVSGMADAAAARLGLEDCRVLMETSQEGGVRAGIGRTGRLPREMTLAECAALVREAFHIERVRVYGDTKRSVRMAAVSPGSGKRMSGYALETGAEVLITGDIDHHEGIDAVAAGLAVIDAGHYGIEKLFVEELMEYLRAQLPEAEVSAAAQREPFVVL